MSQQPSISTTHFSRILIDLGRYIQRINLNRIIDELEAKKIIYPPTAQELRKMRDEYDKSSIVTGIMQGRKEKDFKTFLKIIAAEKHDSKFYDATREFFSGFWQFPGYDEYATWPDGESVMHFGYSIAKGSLMFHQGCNASFAPPTPMWVRPLQINFLFPVHRPHLFHLSTKNSIISVFFHYFRVFLYTQVFN